MSDNTDLAVGARARRALRAGGARIGSVARSLVDRHTRFMALVWGPDWEARHPAAVARAAERRRSNG